ncbi:hypothetical protein MOV66_07870 [Agrobacterium sp. SHOUNA12C]|uniref:hypothetical protein n=1 Tax=Rhizobium rhizogenes TaxID=359 RepID=UPI0002E1FA4A|nr:hypothetical protein [Rhizobium rhizogenes]MCJ9721946.1 hypothetical protein [Agrobacterium sp. BETTINA12B]MCJ9756558.1 hypothetical protein [Agrobacterium sp. SHOUNA12C]NTF68115.1 hypothetical protein [Rhizobium rhizogenes]NTF81181.1 hypothetical protein [Rhizobium rhizogenes]NTG41108.1 hypothetical protein [Rhizobium rhizogenes]
MTAEIAHTNAGGSAGMAKLPRRGYSRQGAEQSFQIEGVGLTETDPAFFDNSD